MAAEPIFLCTQQQLIGDASEERALQQMELLASIVAKLGFTLTSGVAPRFHELWAIPNVPASNQVPADLPPPSMAADDFERSFLAWLHITYAVLPESQSGTNAFYWRFPWRDDEVTFVVIGQGKNTGFSFAPDEWLLRVEESEPYDFTGVVATHFEPGSGVRRKMGGGRIRTQFKSAKFIRQFIDQSHYT
jgi:hypothetical protein